MMNCWFVEFDFESLPDLTKKLNDVASESGVHDVSLTEIRENQNVENNYYTAIIKVTGIAPANKKFDGRKWCKVIT